MLGFPEILDTYSCSQCSHRTESVFQLAHHVQRDHRNGYAAKLYFAIVEPEQFLCICCDFKSYYQFQLYEHCKQVHSLGTTENGENGTFREEIEKYRCDWCKYKSDSSLSLVKHHDLCGTFRDLAVIGNMSMHGPSGKIDGYICNHCLYRTLRKSHLKRHMDSKHTPDDEINWFQCERCSYRAKQKAHLERHTLKHAADEEVKWFQCNHCSYRAKHNSCLKRHLLNHTAIEDINWFQCNHCSYRAKHNSSLKTHLLTHTAIGDINWFQCNHCSYQAKQKSHLRKHMLNKHAANEDVNWFQCNNCSYRAKYNSSLKRHFLLKHAAN